LAGFSRYQYIQRKEKRGVAIDAPRKRMNFPHEKLNERERENKKWRGEWEEGKEAAVSSQQSGRWLF